MCVYALGVGKLKPTRRIVDMPKEQKARVSIRLPVELWKKTQIEAIHRGVNAQDIVAEGLGLYFKKGGTK